MNIKLAKIVTGMFLIASGFVGAMQQNLAVSGFVGTMQQKQYYDYPEDNIPELLKQLFSSSKVENVTDAWLNRRGDGKISWKFLSTKEKDPKMKTRLQDRTLQALRFITEWTAAQDRDLRLLCDENRDILGNIDFKKVAEGMRQRNITKEKILRAWLFPSVKIRRDNLLRGRDHNADACLKRAEFLGITKMGQQNPENVPLDPGFFSGDFDEIYPSNDDEFFDEF